MGRYNIKIEESESQHETKVTLDGFQLGMFYPSLRFRQPLRHSISCDKRGVQESRLMQRLFEISGVEELTLDEQSVTVRLAPGCSCRKFRRQIARAFARVFDIDLREVKYS